MAKKPQRILYLYLLLLDLLTISCFPSLSMDDFTNTPKESPRTKTIQSPRSLSPVHAHQWMDNLTSEAIFPDSFPEYPQMTTEILSNILKNITLNKIIYQNMSVLNSWLYIYQSYDLYDLNQLNPSCTYHFLDKVVNDNVSKTTFWSYLAFDHNSYKKYYFMVSLHHWPSLNLPYEKMSLLKARMLHYMIDARERCDHFTQKEHPHFDISDHKSSLEWKASKRSSHFPGFSKSIEKVSGSVEILLSALSKGLPPRDTLTSYDKSQQSSKLSFRPTRHPQVKQLNLKDLQEVVEDTTQSVVQSLPLYESLDEILSQLECLPGTEQAAKASVNLAPSSQSTSPHSLSTSPHKPTLSPNSSPHLNSNSRGNSPHLLSSSPRTPQLSPTSSSQKSTFSSRSDSPRFQETTHHHRQSSASNSRHLPKSRSGSPRTQESMESPRQRSPRVLLTNSSGIGKYVDHYGSEGYDQKSESKSSEDEAMTVKLRIPHRLEKKLYEGHTLTLTLSLKAQKEEAKEKPTVMTEHLLTGNPTGQLENVPFDRIFDDLMEELLQNTDTDHLKKQPVPTIEARNPNDFKSKTRPNRVSSMPPQRKTSGGIRISVPNKPILKETL